MTTELRTDLEHQLALPDLDHVDLTAGSGDLGDLRLRIDVVHAGQRFYWISYVATTEEEYRTAFAARAAMRPFPWTDPFQARLEQAEATLPVLCRWQRAYPDDTSTLCLTLLTKHFRVPLESARAAHTVTARPDPRSDGKSQKVWLREITAWYMTRA